MTNAPTPIERRGDRRRRGAGEWGRPLLERCGIEDPDALLPGCVQDRRGARYVSAKQTRAALRRRQDVSGTGRGPDDVAEPGQGA
jgi:hypothetical protein